MAPVRYVWQLLARNSNGDSNNKVAGNYYREDNPIYTTCYDSEWDGTPQNGKLNPGYRPLSRWFSQLIYTLPHGAYAQMSRRNRVDHHPSIVARLCVRADGQTKSN